MPIVKQVLNRTEFLFFGSPRKIKIIKIIKIAVNSVIL